MESKSHSFDYCWCSFNQSPIPRFRNLPLTLHEATSPHYRVHRLAHEDSLKLFMATMASIPATLAVVLANLDNTYQLSEKFAPEEGETPPVPVVLVTNEVGSELVRILKENPRDVTAVIHSETPPTATPIATPTLPQPCE